MKRLLLFLAFVVLSGCAATVPAPEEKQGITFVHLNDTYRVGPVDSGNGGGFGRVVTVVRALQAEGRDVRILHGGDFLYPSLESQLWNGLQMIDAFNYMNAIAPMYVVAGNHEFDRRTPQQLAAAVKASEFEWLGDNYVFRTGDAEADAALLPAYTFAAAGKTIGVIALTLHGDDGGNNRDYVPIDGDYLAAAKRVLGELEAKGVDAIIGLTHLHLWDDQDIARLKREYPKLMFVAGGHEHEPQYSPAAATKALVVKGASNARLIWTIDLDFDADGTPRIDEKQIVLDQNIALDAGYQPLDDKWRDRLVEKFPFLEAPIGTAAVPLDGREEIVRSVESNWGNFIVDQMRRAFDEENADLAFINGGTLRIDDVISGDIHFEDVGRTFGFSSFLRYTTLTGAEFRDVMEAGYRGAPTSQGYFPQVSGFRVCIDRSRNEFDRIVSLQVPTENGWQEIDADKTYSVIVSDFLYGGGDGYDIPKDRPASKAGSELKYLVLDAILRAQAVGASIGEPVDPDNPRFRQLREAKEPCWNQGR